VGSVADDFNRADSDTLGAPCPPCPAWAEGQGNLVISAGQLKNTLGGNNIAVLPALSAPTQTAEADFTSVNNNASPRLGIVLRYQNAANYYLLYRIVGGTTALRISKIVDGVETVIASQPVPQPVVNTPFHLRGSVTGQSLTVTLGPASSPSATVSASDAAFASGSLGVLMGSTQVNQYQVDNFSAALQ